jgi:hypothetical protein
MGFYSSMGMLGRVPHGTQPRQLAEQLLLQMASFTQDIAMVSSGVAASAFERTAGRHCM